MSAIACPDCGLELEENATFCPRCRPRVACHRCGSLVYEKALICSHCQQWLGNRWRGPFWFQSLGPHLGFAVLVLGAPLWLVMFWLLAQVLGNFYQSAQRLFGRGINLQALGIVLGVTALSVALLYGVEKRARRKRE